MSTSVKQIKHPYIAFDRKIRGGDPVIADTYRHLKSLRIALQKEIMQAKGKEAVAA